MKRKIITLAAILLTTSLGCVGGVMISKRAVVGEKKRMEKFKTYYNILNQWMIHLHQNRKIDEFFIQRGYQKIAIYGMGELGNRLYEELENSRTEILYVIDQDAPSIVVDVEVKEPSEILEEVDVIIVTAVFDFEEIVKDLRNITSCPVISLEEVMKEL